MPQSVIERRIARRFVPSLCDACASHEPYAHSPREAWKLARAFSTWARNDPRQAPLPEIAPSAILQRHAAATALAAAAARPLSAARKAELAVTVGPDGESPQTRAKIHYSSFEAVSGGARRRGAGSSVPTLGAPLPLYSFSLPRAAPSTPPLRRSSARSARSPPRPPPRRATA